MKSIRLTLVGIIALMCCAFSDAQAQQPNRLKLFEQYPDQINVSNQTLEQVMMSRAGQELTINFGSNLHFTGIVLSNEQKYSNLQTVLIKSPLFENAILSLSRITENDTQDSFTGRIIHTGADDGYVLRKNSNNLYLLAKIGTDHVLQDCSYQ